MADTVRVASYNASLNRSGPGLLLADIRKGEDPQIAAVIKVIRTARPDILLLNEIDYDGGLAAVSALRDRLADGPDGLSYPYIFAAPSNTGIPSGLDLDRDGSTTGPRDAFGYGSFPGQYGMAVLSRFPIDVENSRSFQELLWSDLPAARLPRDSLGAAFPSEDAHAVLRLSSKSHWDVAIEVSGEPLRLFASHPTPPVFDGPEDFNGLRNHDEIAFWGAYIAGTAFTDSKGRSAPRSPHAFVVLGDLNADPQDGDGVRAGIAGLLANPAVQDVGPKSVGGSAAAIAQGGANLDHKGDPALDTADWRDEPGPGNLRVDYVLPSSDLLVTDSGIYWPEGSSAASMASDHRLVWVDLSFP